MSKKLETELYKAATLTFEELGFLLPTPEVDEQQLNAQVEAAVSVDFEGPFSGRLLVRVCGGLLPTLTANMLGEENVPSKSLQYDALGEIANVICGNMLPGMAGSKDVFHVSPPMMAESMDLPPVAEVQVGLGLGRADLLLFISRYPALMEE
ncbi:MAG: chemotaxis protein CheX [Deltaproteobacteria bacterium]|nr:chemotaxis protein CheX [Deltaproteobacteria bacterium]